MNNYKFDLYAALGVNREASPSEIKEAYRNLALNFHPDRNNGLERELNDAMCGINEAYEILSNPIKRIDYDVRVKMGVRFPKPSFYKLVRKANGTAEEEPDNSLEGRIDQLLSKGREIIENVNTAEQAAKVINEVSSVVRVSVGFLRKVYGIYEEDKHYKGKKVNRRA